MILRLAALILLTAVCLIQTAEVPHLTSLTVVEPGDNVTFHCPFSEKDKFFYWSKQPLGHMGQTVAAGINGKIIVKEQFKESRFTVTKEDTQCFLIIRNVSKEDEATYFCQEVSAYSQTFSNGTFLAVNDNNQQKSNYVKQSPETASVQLGDKLTLQCSLENRDQCPGERSVYWFRAGSGGFHPGVVYIHSNSVERVERSCVYRLSKTIQNSSDTGTYYCAVVTCGEILFGEGTKVDTKIVPIQGSELGSVVFVLGALLACCVTVIAVLMIYINGRRVCEHCKGTTGASHNLGHENSTVDQSNDLDGEPNAVNYAAMDFSTTKVKRENKMRREYKQECTLYSDVTSDHHTQQHTSL